MKCCTVLGALLALTFVPAALACSLSSGMQPFVMETATATFDSEDVLEAPEIKVVDITRGIGGRMGSCDGAGLLSLELEWPRGDYKIQDIGFEFQVVSGASSYAVFPATPIATIGSNRKANLLFMWEDDGPAEQKPLFMEVEVRAITHGQLRGPPTRFVVDSRSGS